jgi:hypothetical protein
LSLTKHHHSRDVIVNTTSSFTRHHSKETVCFTSRRFFLWVEFGQGILKVAGGRGDRPGDIHRVGGLPYKYSHLGIIDGMQEGPIFGEKYVPRGTLLWNGYAQYLVCCGKLFLEGLGKGERK